MPRLEFDIEFNNIKSVSSKQQGPLALLFLVFDCCLLSVPCFR